MTFGNAVYDTATLSNAATEPGTNGASHGGNATYPSINATDGIVLRVAMDIAQHLRASGDDLVLVSSDQRLLRSAQAEGLIAFDPETQDQVSLAALVGP